MVLPNPLDAVYGRFQRITPTEAQRLLEGLDRRWWVSGGWAVEAFTGVARPHEDIDISIERDAVGELIRHFQGTLHVWAAGSGIMKPLLDPDDPIPSWAGQVWVRRDASSPWLIDFVLTSLVDDKWMFKRDQFINMPFAEATWVSGEGIRYERPQVTFLYKAKHNRDKDRADLETALPLMATEAVEWLIETIERVHPDHPWLDLLPS